MENEALKCGKWIPENVEKCVFKRGKSALENVGSVALKCGKWIPKVWNNVFLNVENRRWKSGK